ncbi:MAG: 2-C-methyl-D-erythritol 4-phosphate cytidylyltransferase, partial [Alphaproteobacteria bacterium]
MTAEAPVCAVIVAAGLGLRAGGGATPKQFKPLRGKPLLSWSIEAFADHPEVDGVLLVLNPLVLDTWYFEPKNPKVLRPVAGGGQRQDSARNGLEALADRAPARVLIHDAARPLVSPQVISRVIAALNDAPGALPVVPVSDTLKRGKAGGMVEATVAREGLWRAQTPQGFEFRAILAAHRKFAGQNLTDDAAVAEAAGLAVKLVEGDARNIKITEA